ncbi:MAG: GspE/PulE family protein, partial [Patescibacteria group bacterium]
FDVLKHISEESARHYQFVPLQVSDDVLAVGMVYPDDVEAREALKFISANINIPFKVFVISRTDFNRAIEQYKGLGGEVKSALGEFEQEYEEKYTPKKEGEPQIGKEFLVEDTPIIKLVSVILKHATEGRASDIHIEPGRQQLRVRFRLDGTLYTSLFLPKSIHEAVVARIKILTHMKLDEKRKPQDGRFSTTVGETTIDFRVSTFPTYFGEKVVIRILDSTTGVKSLPDLGFAGRNLELIQESMERPYGMILVTGPTGSGKSTTLYAMLQLLNEERSNVVSLEDPVEYTIEGVNQSQVRPEIDYTFATGLRSVLRQDPDIIMVGEIRDKETAQLAIHAALTGHLVLSTLHTNTAIGVIPRLIDMGVDPFLIPATLILAVGQRLVRTLCPDSKKPIPVVGRVRDMLIKEVELMPDAIRKQVDLPKEIYQPLPSPTCPKGTRGRIGVFEVLSMTPEIEKLILEQQPSEAKIAQEADRQGMLTMRQDGILKVLEGKVGMEELSEVVV